MRPRARRRASISPRGPAPRCSSIGEAGPARLLLVAHHLVVDGVSWRILLDDLGAARRAPRRARAPSAEDAPRYALGRAPLRASPAAPRHARGPLLAVRGRGPPWRASAASIARREANRGRRDRGRLAPTAPRPHASSAAARRPYRTRADTICSSPRSPERSLSAWTGRPALLVDLEGHGREDIFDDLDSRAPSDGSHRCTRTARPAAPTGPRPRLKRRQGAAPRRARPWPRLRPRCVPARDALATRLASSPPR